MTGFSNTYGPVRQTSLSDMWTWGSLPIYPAVSPTNLAPPSGPLQVTGSIADLSILLQGKISYMPAFANSFGNELPFPTAFSPASWINTNCTVSYSSALPLNGVGTLLVRPSSTACQIQSTPQFTMFVTDYTIGAWIYNTMPHTITANLSTPYLSTGNIIINPNVWQYISVRGTNGAQQSSSLVISFAGADAGSLIYVGQPIVTQTPVTQNKWSPGDTGVTGITTVGLNLVASGSTLSSFPFANTFSPTPGSSSIISSIIASTGTGSMPPIPYSLQMTYSGNSNPYLQVDATALLY